MWIILETDCECERTQTKKESCIWTLKEQHWWLSLYAFFITYLQCFLKIIILALIFRLSEEREFNKEANHEKQQPNRKENSLFMERKCERVLALR